MGSVRILATVFAWLAWILLALSVLAILATAATIQATFRAQGVTMAAVGSLLPLLLACLVPFLAWGLLTGLCELHQQGERLEVVISQLMRHSQSPSRSQHLRPDSSGSLSRALPGTSSPTAYTQRSKYELKYQPVPVYQNADVASPEIGQLQRGDVFEVQDLEGNFYRVQLPDQTVGFVYDLNLRET